MLLKLLYRKYDHKNVPVWEIKMQHEAYNYATEEVWCNKIHYQPKLLPYLYKKYKNVKRSIENFVKTQHTGKR